LDRKVLDFYEPLATRYHLLFDNWDRAIDRQSKVLDHLMNLNHPRRPLRILDCACGIGTQAIGFAKLGNHVTASDLSPAAVNRAAQEAALRGLNISFCVADMTSMPEIMKGNFDVIAAMDNALPHLSPHQLGRALRQIGSRLAQGGRFIASIRDYDQILKQRPTMQQPAFYGDPAERRIVHQVWDWIDAERYVVHLYITEESNHTWTTHHFVSEYRCIRRGDLSSELESAGFRHVQWLMPAETGYYQPIVVAKLDSASSSGRVVEAILGRKE